MFLLRQPERPELLLRLPPCPQRTGPVRAAPCLPDRAAAVFTLHLICQFLDFFQRKFCGFGYLLVGSKVHGKHVAGR